MPVERQFHQISEKEKKKNAARKLQYLFVV
jgi:hypothetical protein